MKGGEGTDAGDTALLFFFSSRALSLNCHKNDNFFENGGATVTQM